MDEPLSALDRLDQGRDPSLTSSALHETPVDSRSLYVSHDIAEVERLADHLVLMERGRVLAAGPLGRGAHRHQPAERAPPGSLGACSTPRSGRSIRTTRSPTLMCDGETLLVPRRVGELGSRHRVRVAAADVSLSLDRPSPTTISNVLPARVVEIEPLDEAQLNVVLGIGHRDGGQKLLARITRRALNTLELPAGTRHVCTDQGGLAGRSIPAQEGFDLTGALPFLLPMYSEEYNRTGPACFG